MTISKLINNVELYLPSTHWGTHNHCRFWYLAWCWAEQAGLCDSELNNFKHVSNSANMCILKDNQQGPLNLKLPILLFQVRALH